MAIELTDDLIRLQRAANAAREAATSGPYSAEAWRPWLEAAEAVQTAVAEHANATGQNRYEVEMAVKLAAREASES